MTKGSKNDTYGLNELNDAMRVCFRGGGGGAGHLNTGNGFVNGISVNCDGSDFATGRAVTSAFFFVFGNGFASFLQVF